MDMTSRSRPLHLTAMRVLGFLLATMSQTEPATTENEVLKRMLNTPPKPHNAGKESSPKAKKAKDKKAD